MVKIRLARTGRRNQASYRIVVQEVTTAPTAKYIELLGHYNPRLKEKEINVERAQYWIEHGAQPTPTVQNLLVREGVIKDKKVRSWAPKARTESGDEVKKDPPAGGEESAEEAKTPAAEGGAPADLSADKAEAPADAEKPAEDAAPAEEKTEKPAEEKASEEKNPPAGGDK